MPRKIKNISQAFFAVIFMMNLMWVAPAQSVLAKPNDPLPIKTVNAVPLQLPVAAVSLNIPSPLTIGQSFSFTATFDNTHPTDVGYGPFIDVYFPVTGIDGAGAAIDDGINFVSASFLGGSITSVVQSFPAGPLGGACGAAQSRVNHPYAVDNTGSPVIVCGMPGDKVVTFQLPFGSFAPSQVPAVVTINAVLSNLADAGAALTLRTRGGYQYGATPLNDWCCGDPSIVSAGTNSTVWPGSPVVPEILTLTKVYNGPEGETATGPNYPRTFTVTVDIAPGQTVTNLTIVDTLPDNLAYLNPTAPVTAPGGATLLDEPTIGSAASAPNNDLQVRWASVTGGAGVNDASATFSFFVPLVDAGSGRVINASNGLAVNSQNQSTVSGSWTPLDGRDTPSPVTAGGVCPTGCASLTDRSLAIQKSVAIITDVGVTGASPGDTVEFTLDFQISDFFVFQNLVVSDVINDGVRFAAGFTPTLQVDGNPYTSPTAVINAANFTVDNSQVGNTGVPADGTDGSQTINFRVSNELITRGFSNRLVGGCIDPTAGNANPDCGTYNNGQTHGVIVFRAIIQDQFTDTYPSGDASVDHGDILGDTVTVTGRNLNTSTFADTLNDVTDNSSASLNIAFGTLAKSIYAINGVVCGCGSQPYEIKPGDLVTYRIEYSQPSSDFEQTVLNDFLPLPVFSATDPEANGGPTTTWTQDGMVVATPPAGQWKYGPTDTTHLRPSAPTPSLSTDSTNNTVSFTYAAYDDPTNTSSKIDLLFSVTTTSEPFTDRLFLTNQLTVNEGTTNSGSQTLNTIVQVVLTQPILTTKKGIVESSDDPANGGDAVYNPALPASPDFTEPGTAGLRFPTPILSSAAVGNSNISNVDAGDLVTFVILVENTGSSLNGAFDIRIRDTLPAGYVIPGAAPGLNLDVRRGDMSSVSYTNIGTGLFDPAGGIEIADPGLGVGACEHGLVGNGRNVIVITYDLQVDVSFSGGTIINTGTLYNYSGSEGGLDYTTTDLSDTASTTIINSPVKSIVNTSEANTVETGAGTTADPRLAAIGEIVRYRIAVQIPEGTTNNFRIRDTIPAGMSFINDTNTVSLAFVSNQGTCGQNITSSTLGSGPGQCGSTVLAPTFFLNLASASNDRAVSRLDSTLVGNYTADNDDTYGDDTDVYLKLGDITNADRDFDNEYIVVEFNVLMRNEPGNSSGSNLDNTSIYRTGSSSTNSTVSNTTRARVVEPLVTMGKSIVTLPSPLDAGGQVTYRITIANGSGANVSTAFELKVIDTLPSAMTLDALPGSVVVTTLTGTVGTVDITNTAVNSPPSTPSSLDVRIVSLAPNSSVQIDYTATINSSITPGEIVTNTGDLIWTSLPGAKGTTGNSTGSNTSGISGNVLGERDGSNGPSGSPNDYDATSSANFTSDSVAPVKSIVSTSESHTPETGNGSAGNPRDLAIGEIVRYRLAAQIVEGTTTDLQLVDTLPMGFTFLNDGTARISMIADTDITEESDLAGADNDALPPSFVMPASRITVSGQDVTFTVGDLVNNDSDAGAENVVIDFNVIVNNDANNNNTDLDDNDFDLIAAGTTISTSNAVRTRIVEPVLTITKTVSDAHPAPGQIVTFTLVVANTGNATAFDVDITDGIPAQLELDLGSINVVPSGTVSGISDSSMASQVHITASNMAVGAQLVITYDATVLAPLNDIFVNDASTTWTSLPGTNGTLVNSTGSSTPGTPGFDTGERTGSNVGVNDYLDSDQVTLTADRNLIKSLVASNVFSTTLPDVTIGEILTYQLILTIPAGSTDVAILTDTLDTGLAFVDVSTFVISDEDSDGAGGPDLGIYYSGSATPVVTSSGHVVTFNLGDITNTDSTPETITITYRAIVLDILTNVQGGPVLDNDVDLTWSGGVLSTRAVPAVEIVEPHLEIEKIVDPVAAAYGSTVAFSITIDHTTESLTTAYDVVVFDSIPTGLILNEASVAAVTTNGGNGFPTGQVITTTPTTVTVRWNSFPLGAAATITFSAVFSGPAPVFNSATVEWATLQIDPAPRLVPQSTFNPDSTERRYDPLAQAGPNNYVVSSTASLNTPARLPRTGFAPGEVTVLPQKPANFDYEAMSDLWLEIPKLGVQLNIVGVPLEQLDWNLTWLGSNAGYLSGTAYPTHAGNTAITAHAYLADGTPGPFIDLEKLQYGDQVIVHLGGKKYIYQIREESQVRPDAIASVVKHEKYSWLTLITCKTYNAQTKDYLYRSIVRAVLIQVVDE